MSKTGLNVALHNYNVHRVLKSIEKRKNRKVISFDSWFGASPNYPGNTNTVHIPEGTYYFEDQELPPFNTFIRSYGSRDYVEAYEHNIVGEFVPYAEPGLLNWLYTQFAQRMPTGYYDYKNLYSPFCDTAIYYFLEDIVLDFDDMDEDDECYPYGWFDFFAYCDSIGVKLPTYGEDGGKYGKSIRWE